MFAGNKCKFAVGQVEHPCGMCSWGVGIIQSCVQPVVSGYISSVVVNSCLATVLMFDGTVFKADDTKQYNVSLQMGKLN